jgi:hypothetical protein
MRERGLDAVVRPWGEADVGGVVFDLKAGPAPDRVGGGLVFRIDGDAASIGLEVGARAASEARAELALGTRAEALANALEALPEQFALGLAGSEVRIAAASATVQDVRDLLLYADQRECAFWLGWRVPKDVAIEHRALLDEQLEDAVVVLAGIAPLLAVRPRTAAVNGKRSPGTLARGCKVRVLDGPLSGKMGVVRELDGKGKARVMLGLLAVRMDVHNLVPCPVRPGRPGGQARIRLSTSHRKPLSARS